MSEKSAESNYVAVLFWGGIGALLVKLISSLPPAPAGWEWSAKLGWYAAQAVGAVENLFR